MLLVFCCFVIIIVSIGLVWFDFSSSWFGGVLVLYWILVCFFEKELKLGWGGRERRGSERTLRRGRI